MSENKQAEFDADARAALIEKRRKAGRLGGLVKNPNKGFGAGKCAALKGLSGRLAKLTPEERADVMRIAVEMSAGIATLAVCAVAGLLWLAMV